MENSIYSKETNNQILYICKHSFNKYGTYTWTATAYDNFVTKDTTVGREKSKSATKSGTVYSLYDEEYFKKPILNEIKYPTIQADGTRQWIILKGANFSHTSKVHWKSPISPKLSILKD